MLTVDKSQGMGKKVIILFIQKYRLLEHINNYKRLNVGLSRA